MISYLDQSQDATLYPIIQVPVSLTPKQEAHILEYAGLQRKGKGRKKKGKEKGPLKSALKKCVPGTKPDNIMGLEMFLPGPTNGVCGPQLSPRVEEEEAGEN